MVVTLTLAVTTAGTPQPLVAPPTVDPKTGYRVSWCTIQAKSTNTGKITVRAPLSTSPIGYEINAPGDSIVLWSPASLHEAIDLTQVWIDAAVNGEGVNATAVR